MLKTVPRPTVRLAVALALLLLLAGCSRLGLFNAVVPKDAGGARVASDIAYADGPRGKLDIYAPAASGGDDLPVIFFIYGGSWQNGSKDDYAFAGRALAARGYVTVIADYRLVPGVTYPQFLEDGAEALAWTARNIGRHGGDPERLFVAGHSAGAYNAVMLALDPGLMAAEGLDRSVIDGVAALSGPYDFLPLDDDATIAAFSSAGDLEATQPVNLPAAGAPPMLLIHGAADTLVMPRNSIALADHLKDAGRPAELEILGGFDHADTLLALSRPFRDEGAVLERIDAFFKGL